MVSASVSPFAVEVEATSEKPMTLPPMRFMAVSKESMVRVEGS